MTVSARTIPGFIKIGTTGKTRGIDGELKLFVEDQFLREITQQGFLFLEKNGNKVPLRITALREVQDILVKFEDVDDPSAATQWSGCDVFIPSDEIITDHTQAVIPDRLEYAVLSGFAIVDTHLGDIGCIKDVIEYPQQEMAVLHRNGKEILIPLNPVFIIEIDTDSRLVRMDLPAGLLDV